MKLILVVLVLLSLCYTPLRAQVIVNEFSQGASGNKEYIELLVYGTPNCENPCSDIRGWIFDDNNGWYGTTAISAGSYRFASNENWSCVPYGSLIVIYNPADVNPNVPADDPTDVNSDGVYVLPITSPLIELNNSAPNASNNSYPVSGFSSSSSWTNIALNNTNDCIQTIDPNNLSVAYHAVSYGAGVVAPIHISASGGQKVYYLSDGQYNITTSWMAGNVPTDETPGLPNTTANAAFIQNLQNASSGAGSSDTTNQNICSGDSVLFGDVYIATSGFYTDTFTSVAGCDSIVTLNLMVNPIPASPAVTNPVHYCEDETTLPLNATGNNLLWYDSVSDNTGNALAPVPSSAIAGIDSFYVTQTENGCESGKALIVVTIDSIPAAPLVISPDTVCTDALPFTFQAIGNNLLWYDAPTGGTGNNINPVVSTGSGIISKYVSQTLNGCESSRSTVELNVIDANALISIMQDSVCQFDTVIFTNNSNGNDITSYWDFGDGTTLSSNNNLVSHAYNTPGVFTTTLIITTNDGCSDTMQKQIFVGVFPQQFDFSIADKNICLGDQIVILGNATPGFSQLEFNFGDGNIYNAEPDEKEWVHAYTTERQPADSFIINIIGIYQFCPVQKVTDTIVVFQPPIVNLGSDTSLCLGGSPIVISNKNILLPDETYLWSTGDTSLNIIARHPATYSLSVSNKHCTTTDDIEVKKDCYIDIPNSFTPNNDGVNDYFFPRQLLSSSVSSFSMQIFSRWGQMIFETKNASGRGWDGLFNGATQPVGVYVYIIDVTYANGKIEHYDGNVTLLR